MSQTMRRVGRGACREGAPPRRVSRPHGRRLGVWCLGVSAEPVEHVERAFHRMGREADVSSVAGVQAALRRLRFGPLPDALVVDADVIEPYRLDALPAAMRTVTILLGTMERQAARGFDLGVADFVMRPLTTRRLVTALRRSAE